MDPNERAVGVGRATRRAAVPGDGPLDRRTSAAPRSPGLEACQRIPAIFRLWTPLARLNMRTPDDATIAPTPTPWR